nr:A24 family peptidase [uncultured Cellulosilyticum sp.]
MEEVVVMILGMMMGCCLNKYMEKRWQPKGKGRTCDSKYKRIRRYVLTGVYTGLVLGFCYLRQDRSFAEGMSVITLMNMSFCIVLIILSLIDMRCMILPTSIIIFGSLLGIGFKVVLSIIYQDWGYLWAGLVAGGAGYIWFYLIYSISNKLMHREGLGFGDVRIMGMLGLFIGSWQLCTMLIIACAMAIGVGAILLVIRKKSEPYPFGPFLCVATMFMLIWGAEV